MATIEEREFSGLQYKCKECGTPLGFDGLCWKCRNIIRNSKIIKS